MFNPSPRCTPKALLMSDVSDPLQYAFYSFACADSAKVIYPKYYKHLKETAKKVYLGRLACTSSKNLKQYSSLDFYSEFSLRHAFWPGTRHQTCFDTLSRMHL